MCKGQEKGNLAVGTFRVESERSRIARETNDSFRDLLVHGKKIPAQSNPCEWLSSMIDFSGSWRAPQDSNLRPPGS